MEPQETGRSDRETPGVPDWAGLIPAGVAALGVPSRPVTRMIGAQSAVYRLIVALGDRRLTGSSPAGRPEPTAEARPQRGLPAR